MNDADADAESDHNVPVDAVPVPDLIPDVNPKPMENNNLELDLHQLFNDAPDSPPIMNRSRFAKYTSVTRQ